MQLLISNKIKTSDGNDHVELSISFINFAAWSKLTFIFFGSDFLAS